MKKKLGLSNLIKVLSSNIFKFLSSLIIIFILPNFLGNENYGYYKTFLLYTSFLGIFHFGYIDGIYLKFGGRDLNDLNKQKFRSYFFFFLIFQTIISLVLLIITFWMFTGNRLVIFTFVVINLLPINLITYFQSISQITFRFNEYSKRLYLLSILNLLSVALVFILNVSNFILIVIFSSMINFILTFIYIHTYKAIVFGSKIKTYNFIKDIINLFKLGFPLLLSNFVLILILSIDRLFVELFFEVTSFSYYSFGFSILALINIIVGSISTIFYPFFKRIDFKTLTYSYPSLNLLINSIVFLGISIYFPIYYIIPIILPGFIESVPIIKIALSGLIFTSTITTLAHNIFKVANKNKEFFFFGLFALFISIFLFTFSFYLEPKIENIAYSSLIGLIIWFVFLHEYIRTHFNIQYRKNFFYSLLFLLIFLFMSSLNNLLLGGFFYLLFLILFLFLELKNLREVFMFLMD